MNEGLLDLLFQALSLVAGLPLLALGGWWTWRRWQLRRLGLRVMVPVAGYEERDDFDGGKKWQHPVVVFGGQQLVLSQGEQGRRRWPEGSIVPVCYRQYEPERMIIDRPGELFFIPLTIAAMGLGVLGIGWL